ncbi:DUF1176 domain-containing protein [Citrobacter sp. FP75]|uniref:DUF1176 domain-containing protein n=1 Tax=Citrobacter sp. FP75 TaxID=1852949 RepID=UPI001BC96E39|nr:DUF1176 domain-containing protein [Citrobacter sp. FP75]
MRLLHCVLLAGIFSAPLFAKPLTGFNFAHKDWEVACDNTGTCRAAGYGVNAGEISVLLTRQAGPVQRVKGEVTFAQVENDIPVNASVNLFIDNRDRGKPIAQGNDRFRFDDAQVTALLQALVRDQKIEISLNGQRKTLSSAGVNAVFLKIDEYQQRIGTQNALIRKGESDDQQVLKALPPPVINAAPMIPSAREKPLMPAQRQKIAPQIAAQHTECDDWDDDATPAEERQLTLIELDNTHSLIQTVCWRTAYNMGYAVWVVDSALKNAPELITTNASSYADGKITFFNKGRGMADCVSGAEWVWDGKSFVRSLEYSTGSCREIVLGGTWMLPTFVSRVESQQEKIADSAALEALHHAVTERQKTDPELDLSIIADRFPLKGKIVEFTLSYNEDSPQPTAKPSPEISDDEWQAFLRSSISAESENGQVSYTLIDLNGDGKRDLIINSYVGGTGLFSYTGVLKRSEDKFIAISGNADDDDFGLPGALFSENGRGANQWSQWVRISGQVYALWFNGQFGEDNLYLLRPFSTDDRVPAVTVRYRYTLDVIDSAEEGQPLTPPLNDKDRTGLLKALDVMQDHLFKDQSSDQQTGPVCPIPPGTSAENAANYSTGIALHYVYESVAWIPVWLNDKCYIGTVASHHGYYRNGVDAEITLSSPDEENDVIGGYAISGLRHVTSVKSSWKQRESDNGVP